MTADESNRFKILHVDDDQSFLNISDKLLRLKGNFEITPVLSVDEAMTCLEKETYDAIISDYEMPQKDGLFLLQEIIEIKKDVAFILFTGKGREEVAVKALNLGADGYINKLGDPETVYTELVHATTSAILRRKAEREILEKERRYRSLFVNLNEGYAYCKLIFNEKREPANFTLLEVNDAFNRLTGSEKDQVINRNITEVFPEIKEYRTAFQACIRVGITGKSETFELQLKQLKLWLAIFVFSPKKEHFIIILENVTRHKKSEAVANARSEVLEFAIKHTSEELFKYVINCAEQLTDSQIGFFHLICSSESKINLQAWSDKTLRQYCKADPDERHYPLENAGIWADCIRLRRPVICNDYDNYPNRNTLPDGHAKVKRFISVPLFRKGGIIAIIGVGNREYDYDNEDIEIVSQLADLTWEIYKRKRLEELSQRKEATINAMAESSNGPMFMLDTQYNYVFFNHQHRAVMQALFGAEIELEKSMLSYISDVNDQKIAKENIDRALKGEIVEDTKITGDTRFSKTMFMVRHYPVKNFDGKILGVSVFATDLTSFQKKDEQLKTIVDLLAILNASKDTTDLIKKSFNFFREISGCEAIGIRLKKGDDYPYYISDGFSDEHLFFENSLCAKDINEQLIRDVDGNPVIDCMCGNIICGRFDTSKPFFTKGGSFWTNSTTKLLATTTDADRQARTRNRCNGEGYESVALLPLVVGNERLGLIQLNDKRKNMFNEEKIFLFEQLARYLSIAVLRHLSEEKAVEALENKKILKTELFNTEQKYYALVESMSEGILLTDLQGRHLYHNQAYSSSLGYNPDEQMELNHDALVHPDDLPMLQTKKEELMKTGFAQTDYRAKSKDGKWMLRHASVSLVRDNKNVPIAVLLVIRDETKYAREQEHLKMLNEKLKIIGSLTRHDIRNRLSAINTVAFVLKATLPNNTDVKGLAGDLEESVQAMNHLLDFSAVYEKIGAETMGPIDVGKSFNEALKILPNTAKIEITNECNGLMVTADSLLRQLFYNLIANSIKHANNLTKISLTYKQQGNHLTILYADNGQGISEENKPKLFTLGYTTGGTGHGLYLIQKICTTYGWKATEKGEYGKGALFFFEIEIEKK